MLILLYGEDTYRLRQKLNKIIEEYKTKHQSGLSLAFFRENGLDLDKIREKIEAVSMFDEKKLVILENIFKNKKTPQDFFDYAKKSKLKENQDVILVIVQEGKLAVSSFKNKLSMLEEFSLLKGAELTNWVKGRFSKDNIQIEPGALGKLVAYVGSDLWQMSNEIGKLVSYKKGNQITEDDIDLLVKSNLDTNIFKTLDALAFRDKKTALKLLHEHLEQGENEIYLLTMLIYQVRTLLKLKDLMERNVPYYSLAKKSGLHPFVVKKSSGQLRNFSLEGLKKIYQRLLEIDFNLKKGKLDGQTALDLLVAEI